MLCSNGCVAEPASRADPAGEAGSAPKRSRRKMAGSTPMPAVTTPTAIASPAAPATMSSKKGRYCMMARNHGEMTYASWLMKFCTPISRDRSW